MRRTLPIAALAILVAACGPGPNDTPGSVHDLRVLAMRLDPPEVFLPMDPSSPPVDVGIEALVASPEGGPVKLSLEGCPDTGSAACQGVADSLDPTQQTLYAPLTDAHQASLPVPTLPSAPAVVYTESRSLPVPLLADLLKGAGYGGLLGARPLFEVDASAASVSERAFKRLEVSYPDSVYEVALAQAGISICDSNGQPAGCVALHPRTPNQNPVLEHVRYQRSTDGPNAAWRALPSGPLSVAAGERVTFFPVSKSGSAEKYQTLSIDVQNRTVKVTNETELLIYSWFATKGSFDLDVTEVSRTRGVRNAYTAPKTVPQAGEDAFVWIVLRDTRGGVDFQVVPLRLTP